MQFDPSACAHAVTPRSPGKGAAPKIARRRPLFCRGSPPFWVLCTLLRQSAWRFGCMGFSDRPQSAVAVRKTHRGRDSAGDFAKCAYLKGNADDVFCTTITDRPRTVPILFALRQLNLGSRFALRVIIALNFRSCVGAPSWLRDNKR
jgi:hypothetical protein